jgi:hypothetical protein
MYDASSAIRAKAHPLANDAPRAHAMNTREMDPRPGHPAELIEPGVRGNRAKRCREGTEATRIDPILHELFAAPEAVNRALREHVEKHKAI